jgi:hypothetical protein
MKYIFLLLLIGCSKKECKTSLSDKDISIVYEYWTNICKNMYYQTGASETLDKCIKYRDDRFFLMSMQKSREEFDCKSNN